MALVEVVNRTTRGAGTSDTATLQAAFSSTPALSGYDNAAVETLSKELHDGVVVGNSDFPNQSLDHTGAPLGAEPADVGGPGGDAWTNWAPNVASPTVPGALANDIPNPPPGSPRSSQAGSTRLPGETSPQIASQAKGPGNPGNLIKGKSGATP